MGVLLCIPIIWNDYRYVQLVYTYYYFMCDGIIMVLVGLTQGLSKALYKWYIVLSYSEEELKILAHFLYGSWRKRLGCSKDLRRLALQ